MIVHVAAQIVVTGHDWVPGSCCLFLGPSGKPGTRRERVMSSYPKYCRDQAAECARRARLASSREIAASCASLGLRWIRLAEKAEMSGRIVGNAGKEPVTPRA